MVARKIPNSLHLPIETAIIVPSTDKNQNRIADTSFKKRVSMVRKWLSNRFGGYTSVTAIGGYYSTSRRKLIKEPGVIVWAYATQSAYNNLRQPLIKYCRDLAKRWGQDSIGLIIENDLYYINP